MSIYININWARTVISIFIYHSLMKCVTTHKKIRVSVSQACFFSVEYIENQGTIGDETKRKSTHSEYNKKVIERMKTI